MVTNSKRLPFFLYNIFNMIKETLVQIANETIKLTAEVNGNAALGAYIGAGIAMVGAMGCGMGEGIAASRACEALGRNPEAENKIRTMMIIGCAISETSGIYGFIVALLLIFVAPK
jgi:F-type H+-transporting ATPase subunit c